MTLLEPHWDQLKPTLPEVQEMCRRLILTAVGNPTDGTEKVLGFLQKSHRDGGALFASFRVGESEVFDWFASRNRLAEYSILTTFLEGTSAEGTP